MDHSDVPGRGAMDVRCGEDSTTASLPSVRHSHQLYCQDQQQTLHLQQQGHLEHQGHLERQEQQDHRRHQQQQQSCYPQPDIPTNAANHPHNAGRFASRPPVAAFARRNTTASSGVATAATTTATTATTARATTSTAEPAAVARISEKNMGDRDRRMRELRNLSNFLAPAPPLARMRYTVEKVIGQGAYGVVVQASDGHTGSRVAVKRIQGVLNSPPIATRTLRELKFLRLLSPHSNIIQVKDVLLPGEFDSFNDTFVVFELMPIDLGRLLRTSTKLSPSHIKYFMLQLVRGIHFIHSSNVFHRDLKPNNILINEACELRICDFGLARASFENRPDTLLWTDYVATRWYRAPELIMEDHTTYSTAIDMWSVGCIFAEMLSGGRVLFPGTSGRHQFELITDVLGSPPAEVIRKLRNPNARRMLTQFLHPHKPPRDLQTLFPDAPPEAVDVLRKLLVFDQDHRISALQVLEMPFFADYRYYGLGAIATPLPAEQFEFERTKLSKDDMRREFLQEILHYHPEESEAVLADYCSGDSVRMQSASELFGRNMDRVMAGENSSLPDGPRSFTLQYQVLNGLAGDRPGRHPRAGYPLMSRQHVTMSEREFGRLTNS